MADRAGIGRHSRGHQYRADLDSWVGDFSLTRLPATFAAGAVTLSRFTPTLAAFVPLATQIRSSDGSQTFAVTADATNPAYSNALGGYNLGAGVASLSVPVLASTAGAAGNMQPNTATVLGSALAGVDSVTNPLPFAGGADAEGDAALRLRFADYIQSRSLATDLAVQTAVQGIQQNLAFAISENMDAAGNSLPGTFIVTLDDGSGNPPASLLATATAAVEAVRPTGSAFSVRPPAITIATVAMTLGVANPATRPAAIGVVKAALQSAINALPIGATLPWSRLPQIAYDASSLVTNVTAVTLNGGTADIAVPAFGAIKTGNVTVS